MARPWRLRHKLVLGLVLVIASIGLLLGGAMLGLSSYVQAGRFVEDKLYLMQVVAILREHINLIGAGGEHANNREDEKRHILNCCKEARITLGTYRKMQADGGPKGDVRYEDARDDENARLDKIEHAIADLERAVAPPVPTVTPRGERRVIDDPKVREAYNSLAKETTELMGVIAGHIQGAIERANANHRRGTAIATGATTAAVVLVLTLLYYFKVWVFTPIRQLQAGVQRVHGGDFDHPIRLKSQDELEELANEFNAMTARLRDIYKDLAHQVNERSRQLVRSERMVSVGFLAAGVAHEINNPLASIAFGAEAMERRLHDLLLANPGPDAEQVAKYLRVIQQEAFRCKQITQKLLDFSRSGERRREATDLGRLVQDVIDVTRVLPDHRGKNIQFAPATLFAPVSPPDVKSVVLNLIVNALESMDDGGTLAIGVRQSGDVAEIAFRDTGCGMTAEVLENIFEPFYTRRRTGNGTGLGLSISHRIIEEHGGTILAASDGAGKGSTFVVRLPLKAADPAAEPVADAVLLPFPGSKAA